MWTNTANDLLYITHEQHELPGTPSAGQTVCSAFATSDPFNPKFLAPIPLGSLKLAFGTAVRFAALDMAAGRTGSPAILAHSPIVCSWKSHAAI